MTALIPLYLKTTYKNDPMFKDTKSVFTVYNNSFEHRFDPATLVEKAKMMDIDDAMLTHLATGDFNGFIKLGCAYADAVVNAGQTANDSLTTILNEIAEHKLDSPDAEINVTERYFNIYTALAS